MGEFGDFEMAVVKLKTGKPALRFTMELSARTQVSIVNLVFSRFSGVFVSFLSICPR